MHTYGTDIWMKEIQRELKNEGYEIVDEDDLFIHISPHTHTVEMTYTITGVKKEKGSKTAKTLSREWEIDFHEDLIDCAEWDERLNKGEKKYRYEYKKLDEQNMKIRQMCKKWGVVFHATKTILTEKQLQRALAEIEKIGLGFEKRRKESTNSKGG